MANRAQIPANPSDLVDLPLPSSDAQIQSLPRPPCPSAQIHSRQTPPLAAALGSTWGAKCLRSFVDSGRRCSDAEIQSWYDKLRMYNNLFGFSTTQVNPSWGVKRARTALAATPCRPPPESDSNRETRDWANIGDGPAGRIAELALASDVASYLRFRAVCRPWRRCSLDPRSQGGLDGRYHPRQWIMLDKAFVGPRLRRFLNVSTGECIRMDLPELDAHTLLAVSPEGLLFLLHEVTLAVRLLNPLTRQVTDLPPVTLLLTRELLIGRRLGCRLGESISVCSVGVLGDASAVAVAVCFYSPAVLVVAKPGDERWSLVLADNSCFKSALTFAGRMYCATSRGVMVLDASTDEQHPPRMLTAVVWNRSCFHTMADSLHLVDNGADLMLVHRMLRRRGNDDEDGGYVSKYEVYKVDLSAGILILAQTFCGRAVFMGMTRALSVSRKAFPTIAPDTLYLGCDCYDMAASYNLADGSRELLPKDKDLEDDCLVSDYDEIDETKVEMPPSNIVDCLRYCIRGIGNELV